MSSQWLNALEDRAALVASARAQVVERLVGEHHAPAEGVVGAVALDDGDLVRRVVLLHQKAEVQAGRAAADADDLIVVCSAPVVGVRARVRGRDRRRGGTCSCPPRRRLRVRFSSFTSPAPPTPTPVESMARL